ncbi:MAG: hypothetical protein ACE5G3_10875, partial [Gammaproteobacteria bacterium]
QGPHQLAQTLMISGLPRNSDNIFGGPFRPRIVVSGRISPIPTSPGVSANPTFSAVPRQSNGANNTIRTMATKCTHIAQDANRIL